MTPSTCRYQRIVSLAAVLFIACLSAWTTRPAVAQPSYCTPDPKEPLVGCWRITRSNDQPANTFYVLLPNRTWYALRRTEGVPKFIERQQPTGLWSRVDAPRNELVLTPVIQSGLFGNGSLPATRSAVSFRGGDSLDETILADLQPDLVGTRFHWERLGNSSSFAHEKIDTAANELANAWNNGGTRAQIARSFFDFERLCTRDNACSKELRDNFDYEKLITIEESMVAILLPEVDVAAFGGTAEGGFILRLSRRFSKQVSVKPPRIENPFSNGRTPTDQEIENWAEANGWTRVESGTGPVKYTDEKGVPRVTIKEGSSRTPGSEGPHVELRDETGQRVDTQGNPVSRRSQGNHTPYTKK